MSRRILMILVGGLACCGSPTPSEPSPEPERSEPKPAPSEPSEPSPEPEPVDPAPRAADLGELAGHPGLAIGPAVQASEQQRVTAALALLTDGSTASQLPQLATDLDKKFDAGLVESMNPKPVRGTRELQQKVEMNKPTVGPGLAKDIVRRIARAHINELRWCYLSDFAQDPNLSGKIVLTWTIGADGRVSQAKIASDTVGDSVAECSTKAVSRWVFPKPRAGGTVDVTYPFAFAPG